MLCKSLPDFDKVCQEEVVRASQRDFNVPYCSYAPKGSTLIVQIIDAPTDNNVLLLLLLLYSIF